MDLINGRMLEVLKFLQQKPDTSYREIAEHINAKERCIRYDVDRINDILDLNRMPLIEKHSKGILKFNSNIEIENLQIEKNFIYTQKERIDILLMLILIDNEKLNIQKLSEDFEVSRSTVKSDLSLVENQLAKDNLKIEYNGYFKLVGDKDTRVALMNKEINKYIYLFSLDSSNINNFHQYMISVIQNAFEPVSIYLVIDWVDDLLDTLKYTLANNSYQWYVTHILVLVWFVINDKEHSLENNSVLTKGDIYCEEEINSLEKIIGKEIETKKRQIIVRLLQYTSKYLTEEDIDFIFIENTVFQLIECMSKAVGIDFLEDSTLIEGLMNHIAPLIKRMENRINICEDFISILSKKDTDIFNHVQDAIVNIELLKNIDNKDEITYLSIHFIASMKRLQKLEKTTVLLICGLGYGTTTLVKETLISEYEVDIIDVLPVYKVNSYENWEDVDFIISTVKLDNNFHKKYILVNPLLTKSDYKMLDDNQIPRKKMFIDYNSINQKLDFLEKGQREKVMNIIGQELGIKKVIPSTIYKLSELLSIKNIEKSNRKLDWEEAVNICCDLLENQNLINQNYKNNIFKTINEKGFYSVIDKSFALIHGKAGEGVSKTCMSLMVSDEEICFGDKSVKVVFCLASKDNKQQIPSLIQLMQMVKNYNIIEKLEKSKNENEILEIIEKCEKQILEYELIKQEKRRQND